MTLEDGYASLSREAMRKLLPLMERDAFRRGEEKVYGEYAGRWDCAISCRRCWRPCRSCAIRWSAAD